jgi:hypothetical protein
VTAQPPPSRRWGTLAEAAAERHCSVKTIRRMVARGEVYAERLGPRMIRVDLNSVAGRPLTVKAGR